MSMAMVTINVGAGTHRWVMHARVLPQLVWWLDSHAVKEEEHCEKQT